MKDYTRQIKSLIDSLKAAGRLITIEYQNFHILSGLGHEYEYNISVITAKTNPITIQEVTSLLLSHESRLERESTTLGPKDTTLPSVNLVQSSTNLSEYK